MSLVLYSSKETKSYLKQQRLSTFKSSYRILAVSIMYVFQKLAVVRTGHQLSVNSEDRHDWLVAFRVGTLLQTQRFLIVSSIFSLWRSCLKLHTQRQVFATHCFISDRVLYFRMFRHSAALSSFHSFPIHICAKQINCK